MAIIDPEGLFNGDRLRRCSNLAQLHWPRLYLASDGNGRLEINYARIIGRAYPSFKPIPSEEELTSWIEEFVAHYLLFVYGVDGQEWGQWDTPTEFLPRYKTARDRRSPLPPEPEFTAWKQAYRSQDKRFPKCFSKVSEDFLHGVGVGGGVGDGKNICASPSVNARLGGVDSGKEPTSPQENAVIVPIQERGSSAYASSAQLERWFVAWWAEFWLHKAKKNAAAAFRAHVRSEARFQKVMAATRAQSPEMLEKDARHRPHGATWLNGERWDDETTSLVRERVTSDDYPEIS